MKMSTRVFAVAGACLFAVPAMAGFCADKASFSRMLASEGKTIVISGTVPFMDGTTVPMYFATSRDGRWTVYYVREDILACKMLEGSDWTEQGEIPKADLRP